MDNLLTRKEAAKYLKVTVRTVDNLTKRNLIRTVKVGSNVRIPESSIRDYLWGATAPKYIQEFIRNQRKGETHE